MKVKDLISEGIEYRGVRADAFGATNTKFFNRHINANKVLKTYYYVHGHLHPKLEKDKEHLETDLNFYDKNTKKEVS